MIDKSLIQAKVGQVMNYLDELSPVLKLVTSEIISDVKTLRFLERNFQLIVDTVLDINSHIIVEKNFKVPETYSNTFIILGENDILPLEFAQTISNAVKLRNMVVHKYEKVDNKKMIENLKAELDQFKEYLVHLDDFLNKEK